MNYFPRIGVAEFLCEAGSLKKGDNVYITGPTTGVIEFLANEMRVNLKLVEEVVAGERFSVALPRKARRADKLYKRISVTE